MSEPFGHTRDVVKERYALRTPAGFVPSRLRAGATASLSYKFRREWARTSRSCKSTWQRTGKGAGNTGSKEWLTYVLSGRCAVTLDGKKHALTPGSFVYAPPETEFHFRGNGARLLIFQKTHVPLPGAAKPEALAGNERDVEAKPFLGQKGALLQVLLPDDLRFDMAGQYFYVSAGRHAAVCRDAHHGARFGDAARAGGFTGWTRTGTRCRRAT